MSTVDRSDPGGRAWVDRAVAMVEADARRSADTHLLVYPLPPEWGVDLYLKDESTHPTGSLKHRLARSLFLYGLCSGQIAEGSTMVEASSGSTAVSEAYFARMLGLPFVAVMPRSTSQRKIELIERYGGRCEFVDSGALVYQRAQEIADETSAAESWQRTVGRLRRDGPTRAAARASAARRPSMPWSTSAATRGTTTSGGRWG